MIPDSEPPAALPPGVYVYARVREGHEQVAPVRDAAGRRQEHSQRDCFGIKSFAAEIPKNLLSKRLAKARGPHIPSTTSSPQASAAPMTGRVVRPPPHKSFEMAWGQ